MTSFVSLKYLPTDSDTHSKLCFPSESQAPRRYAHDCVITLWCTKLSTEDERSVAELTAGAHHLLAHMLHGSDGPVGACRCFEASLSEKKALCISRSTQRRPPTSPPSSIFHTRGAALVFLSSPPSSPPWKRRLTRVSELFSPSLTFSLTVFFPRLSGSPRRLV